MGIRRKNQARLPQQAAQFSSFGSCRCGRPYKDAESCETRRPRENFLLDSLIAWRGLVR